MKIGKVTENPFKRSILKQIKTKRKEVLCGAGLGGDCAIFSLDHANFEGKDDRFVVVSATQAGQLPIASVVQKCKNTLAARGAEGLGVSLQILLPQDAAEEELKAILEEAEAFCAIEKMEIVQAQAQVLPIVTAPYVTVTAFGTAHAKEDYHTLKSAGPDEDIVISKWIGLEGTAILAQQNRDAILQRYPGWLVEEAASFSKYLDTSQEAAVAMKSGVCAIHNLSEGGIFAALWELGEGAGVGLTIDLKKLPIRQETVEICNYLNINPYELLSGGGLLMTTKDGPGLVTAFEEAGIPAVIVGKTTDKNERLIKNEDEIRFLDRPHSDSIYGDVE